MGNKPIEYNPAKGRLQAEKEMSFESFIDTLYALLSTVWGEGWGQLTMNHPKTMDAKNVDTPIIVYALKERKPGKIGKDTVELVPRVRETIRYTNEETQEEEAVQLMGQVMDYSIEFIVVEENNDKVLKLTHEFTRILKQYKGILMKDGMLNMWFEKEYEEGTNGTGKDDLATRGVVYNLRLEELYEERNRLIEEIRINVDTEYRKLKEEKALPSQKNY